MRYRVGMTRYPESHKQETRARIVAVASGVALTQGFSAGIDRIMKAAGLTRGGFYAHFRSKAELEDAVIAQAMDNTRAWLLSRSPEERSGKALRAIVDVYLSERHRDEPENGCPLPALSADVARADDDTRDTYTSRLLLWASAVEARLPAGKTPSFDRALAIVALLAGGVALARAVREPALSKRILDVCKRAALRLE